MSALTRRQIRRKAISPDHRARMEAVHDALGDKRRKARDLQNWMTEQLNSLRPSGSADPSGRTDFPNQGAA